MPVLSVVIQLVLVPITFKNYLEIKEHCQKEQRIPVKYLQDVQNDNNSSILFILFYHINLYYIVTCYMMDIIYYIIYTHMIYDIHTKWLMCTHYIFEYIYTFRKMSMLVSVCACSVLYINEILEWIASI